jgi:cytoskeletal protein RodZ
MASQIQCNSFSLELYKAIHDFTASTGDAFKLALYTSAASLSANTTVYTTTNESSGTGYTAGGAALTGTTPVLVTEPATGAKVVVVTFANPTFTSITVTYRQALIYNSSKANRAVAVFILSLVWREKVTRKI